LKNTVFWVLLIWSVFFNFVENQNDMVKLLIKDHADPSAGLFPQEWTIECPFEKDDTAKSFLDWFRHHMEGIYSEFSEGKVTAEYDFERINQEEYEATL